MNHVVAGGESPGSLAEQSSQEAAAITDQADQADQGESGPTDGAAAPVAPLAGQPVSPERPAWQEPLAPAGSAQGRRVSGLRHALWPVAVGALVLLVDQLTKEWVLRSLAADQEGASWFGGNLSLIHVNNDGAAFGLLAGQVFLFVLIALVVAAVVVAYYRFLPRERLWLRVSLGLQLGGALGNLLDRLRHGYVVDFVEIRALPVFNVADASIVCGVLILAYYLLVHLDTPSAQAGPAQVTDEGGKPHGAPPAS